jgi:hypothetical protein
MMNWKCSSNLGITEGREGRKENACKVAEEDSKAGAGG